MRIVRNLSCVVFGHPRIINICFGEVTCARCGAILGDTIGGVYRTAGKVVADHANCDACREVPLRWYERLFTKMEGASK